ncbi:MAG TPA: hypothetical protein DD379_19675 [Cyanobacteria bacterium UBA11162]|nr:hypothetical protein [Cyanobacteria bacterium UBA11162]
MTTTNSAKPSPNSPPLRVVPPTSQADTFSTSQSEKSDLSTDQKDSQGITTNDHSTATFPDQRLLIISGIVVSLGLLSQIPVSNSVQAEAHLEPVPNSHQVIYSEIPGTLTEILVQPNQQVNSGQSVAVISTEDLSGEIANTKAKLQETLSAFESASGQLTTLNSKVNEASYKEAGLRRQLEERHQELEEIAAGLPLPEIDRLNRELLALKSNISGLNSEIAGYQSNLSILQSKISNYRELVSEGVIAQSQLDDLLMKEATLKGEIGFKESEIKQIEAQIAAKQAEIAATVKQMQDELKRGEDQLKNLVAERQTASLELQSARIGVASQVPLLNTLKTELNRQQNQQQTHQFLKTQLSGLVISQGFQKLLGKKMQPGEPVLEIADLSELVAIIEVSQEDSDIVRQGAEVKFYPKEPGFSTYTTRITKRDLVMQPDPSGQKQLLQVRAVIENYESRLIPGAKVYAEIESEKMPLYEKVRRELVKLFKFCKYGVC